MEKSLRVQDFERRAKSPEGREQLAVLRNGEIEGMRVNSAEYRSDRRRRCYKVWWEENCKWVQEINAVLGLEGYDLLNLQQIWEVAFGYPLT